MQARTLYRGWLVAMSMLMLAACSHRTTRVERAMVLPPTADRHAIESGQRFLMAAPVVDPDPGFPVDARLDATMRLCTGFVVNADGTVGDVVIDRADAGCADPADPAVVPFAMQVVEAVRTWRYFAAAVCTFPEGADPDADPRCNGDGVRVDAVPIRLRYVFAFSSERGGRVSRERTAPAD